MYLVMFLWNGVILNNYLRARQVSMHKRQTYYVLLPYKNPGDYLYIK